MAWAHISARLWRRPYIERMRILADEGVAAAWSDADQHWLAVLVDDIEAGRLQRMESYVDLCRRAAERDATELVDPLPEQLRDTAPPIGWQPVTKTAPPAEPVVATQENRAPVSGGKRRRAQTLPLEAERTKAMRPVSDPAERDDPAASRD